MADTNFVAQNTTIVAAWLNQINLAIFQGRSPNMATTTGAANAQILTLAAGSLYTGQAAGDTFGFIAGFTNTGAATLQIVAPGGSLAAAALEMNGAALTGGEVIAGQPYVVGWDGTAWQLVSLAGTPFGTSLLQTANAAAAATLIGAIAKSLLTATGDMLYAASPGAPVRLPSGVEMMPTALGRLTLTSGVPVTTADVTGATTVYFTPYKGNVVSLYDGTMWVPTIFTELSQATTDSTKSPAAVANNSNYDVFVWNDAGTLRATRGPAWSSDTARGTGAATTELELFEGRYVNKVDITNGPVARRGLYVGTIRSDGSAQINDSAAKRHMWNNYNRISRRMRVVDTTDSWTYTGSYQQANASAANQLAMVVGLSEDPVNARVIGTATLSSAAVAFGVGIGVGSTSVSSTDAIVSVTYSTATAGAATAIATYNGFPGIGSRTLVWLEFAASGTATWYGDNGLTGPQNGIQGEIFA